MKKRVLGATGIEISEIGVGAWQLGGPLTLDGKTDGHPDIGRAAAIALIRGCGDLGVTFIDTAEQYGAGESELRVGLALEGQRDRWVISSKFGAQVGPNGERVNDVSARRVAISLEDSLRRLKTDRIDVYVYHTKPDRSQAEEVARVLTDAKRAGKVRAVGISSDDLEQVHYPRSLGCLDVVQFSRSLLSPDDAPLTEYLAEHAIGGVVRGAFASGRLSGKYFRMPPAFRPDDVRSTRFDPSMASAEFSRYAVFSELVTPGRTMAQVAVRWLLDERTTHTIILGARSIADYRVAIGACDQPALRSEERKRIGELRQSLAVSAAAR